MVVLSEQGWAAPEPQGTGRTKEVGPAMTQRSSGNRRHWRAPALLALAVLAAAPVLAATSASAVPRDFGGGALRPLRGVSFTPGTGVH